MKKVKYVGPSATGVVLPAQGGLRHPLRVGPGETVQVPAELADSLVEQPDAWKRSTAKATNTQPAGADDPDSAPEAPDPAPDPDPELDPHPET